MKQAQVLPSPASPPRPGKSHGQVLVAPQLTKPVTTKIVAFSGRVAGHRRCIEGPVDQMVTREATAALRRPY